MISIAGRGGIEFEIFLSVRQWKYMDQSLLTATKAIVKKDRYLLAKLSGSRFRVQRLQPIYTAPNINQNLE